MSNRELIKIFLTNSGNPYCDDCLSIQTTIAPRQNVNQICRSLASTGLIDRDTASCSICGKVKLVNQIVSVSKSNDEGQATDLLSKHSKSRNKTQATIRNGSPWYWEGNIQSVITSYLAKNDYKIISVANTSARTLGKDIEAFTPEGKYLWITVKGWPEKSQNTQARHWFSQALMDIILYRDESSSNELGLGLPDGYATYLNLANRIGWFKEKAQLQIYWVSKDGVVRVE